MTTAGSADHIRINLREGILHIQMNRPEKKNALTRAMYQTMADAIRGADEDGATRVILLTGTADCFTSGNDLADFIAVQQDGGIKPLNAFLPAISQAKKPVIAAVNGVAIGIGTTMLLHCDLVYAGTKARFQLPFVNLGLCPELASSLLLPRLVGHQRAAELLLLGEPFGAEIAKEFGLVNAVCPEETLFETAFSKARQLAAQPPASVRLTKALMKRPVEAAVSKAVEEELVLFVELLKSPAAAEAFQAFLEKRKPDFSRFS
ncbi:MAG: enoyl-CoA hydratase [Deltaproteobacteria bacterium]|nr:enoyl-CoA hydratase [Deltaproteobacteria bacterium]